MSIEPDDLSRPASLTLWPSEPDAPKAVEPRPYPTLQEALHEAGLALTDETGTPWIITESGLILSPSWLRGHLGAEPSRAGPAAASQEAGDAAKGIRERPFLLHPRARANLRSSPRLTLVERGDGLRP